MITQSAAFEGHDGPNCDKCGACEPDMDVYSIENKDNSRLEFLCVDCYEESPEYEAECDAQ